MGLSQVAQTMDLIVFFLFTKPSLPLSLILCYRRKLTPVVLVIRLKLLPLVFGVSCFPKRAPALSHQVRRPMASPQEKQGL
jgi:hypothetical protein